MEECFMVSRKEKHKTKDQRKFKLLIGVLLLTFAVLGNIGVAFADQDINSLLASWFNHKGTESVNQIDQAITTEKEQQEQRLKEELQLEIENSSKQLQQFTAEEKEKRVQAIKTYADQLAAKITVDNSKEKQKILDEMDSIIQKAMKDLDKIDLNKKDPSNDSNPKNDEIATSTGNEIKNLDKVPLNKDTEGKPDEKEINNENNGKN
jgi:hypothetical protein